VKRYKKPRKFYLLLLLITFVIIGGYTLYLHFSGNLEASDIWNLFALPVIFVGIYWAGDTLLQKISDKRFKTNYEDRFVELVNQKMRDSKKFLIEDFRKLQLNPKFQESLKMGYQIYQNGESEVFTIAKLEKKFDLKSVEGLAMTFVIQEIQEKLSTKPE